ncbi:DHA2 family efflux MFS transporter permease subunit [Nocardioides lentus]|uniref:DHA2 family efflux MFS transporter permease subunit n=1 Tax=Nocardioides lentus TaxID=338077 RepID=A0ABN2PA19_9ACTN
MSATTSVEDAPRLTREQVLLLASLLVGTFVVILNETTMSVALPVLQSSFGVGAATGQWLTTAFLLTMGSVIPLTGFLIQRVPTRVLFLVAMGLFAAGTLLAALAPVFSVLLVARIIQASGTAIMVPLLMTTVMEVVPVARRGQMMGNITVVIAVAPALGPTVSGLVLDTLGWRWIFGSMLPIALLVTALGARYVVPIAESRRTRIDLLSVPLAVVGFGALVYGLSSIGESAEGGHAVPVWLPFVVGVAALVAFVVRQLALQREDRALLDLRVFAARGFPLALGATLIAMLTMLGTFILVPYFAQQALAMDPLTTGLLTLPGGLLMGALGPVVGRIYDARGPRVLLVPGSLLVTGALWLLSTVSVDTGFGTLAAAFVLLSVGIATLMTPLMTVALGSVPQPLYSHGSAILSTLQQVAGAAGTALFVTVMTVVATASPGGVESREGIAEGVSTAFMVAGCIALVLVALVPFVRRPAETPAGTPAGDPTGTPTGTERTDGDATRAADRPADERATVAP